MITGKKIVITGGAGFIGSNLAHELSSDNEVIIIDNLLTGKKSNINGLDIQFHQISIINLEKLQSIFANVDYVLHQAALPSVPRSIENPLATNENNIEGTLKVLIAARDQNVKKVILASSSSVYGDTPLLPKVETMIINPLSPYALTKVTLEYYAKQFFKLFHLPTICLRYFNVFGPRQDPESFYTGVITKFFTAALKGENLVIYGDGNQSRDFTYIKDVVHANIKALESSKGFGEIFNIAKGERATINELAYEILDLTDSKSEIKYTDSRSGDIKHSLADIEKAKELINYNPKFSLSSGLSEGIEWFKSLNI